MTTLSNVLKSETFVNGKELKAVLPTAMSKAGLEFSGDNAKLINLCVIEWICRKTSADNSNIPVNTQEWVAGAIETIARMERGYLTAQEEKAANKPAPTKTGKTRAAAKPALDVSLVVDLLEQIANLPFTTKPVKGLKSVGGFSTDELLILSKPAETGGYIYGSNEKTAQNLLFFAKKLREDGQKFEVIKTQLGGAWSKIEKILDLREKETERERVEREEKERAELLAREFGELDMTDFSL